MTVFPVVLRGGVDNFEGQLAELDVGIESTSTRDKELTLTGDGDLGVEEKGAPTTTVGMEITWKGVAARKPKAGFG